MFVLVTGANGFIGKYLVKALIKQGVRVLATSHDNKNKDYFISIGAEFCKLDVTNPDDFKLLPKAVKAVVHTAALLRIDRDKHSPQDYINVNAYGTFNVLEYCREIGAKIIYTMTHSDIDASSETIIKEETERCYVSPYGSDNVYPFIVSKIAGVNFIEAYDRDGVVQGIIFRISNIRGFGSRDTRYNCVFHQMITKAQKSEDIEIWGEHNTIRDMIYIKDVVNVIIKAIHSKSAHGLYNIGFGKGVSIEDEAKSIIKVFSPPDNESKLIYRPDIEEVRKKSTIFDNSKARKEFEWEPIYNYYYAMVDYKKEMERSNE